MNQILVLSPYFDCGSWVFDDARVGLIREPFVSGIPEMINKLVSDAGIENAQAGFQLLFSAEPFPEYQVCLNWQREEYGGNWYNASQYDMTGWLCPALFKYFDKAPNSIYVKAQPL